ncbi:MAG: branched-chain amino acid ABC transporter permease [Fimbriimonadaceae bacterium]|nr:MAG: branched-chain amino acid ABC transporter permease [Fimbriimonadaceae bacterium]
MNGLLLGSIYALIALGYTMVYGVLRLINFAHGEVFMLGSYVALFVSWGLGFHPADLARADRPSSALYLAIMLLASMAVCALIGVLIERLAYRPMRSQPRIASLITAIGVSLFIQYAGGLFLPQSPPPAISEQINPYRGSLDLTLKPAPAQLLQQADTLQGNVVAAQRALEAAANTPEEAQLRTQLQESQRQLFQVQGEINNESVDLTIPIGQLIMLGTTVALMGGLWYLVQKTKTGRAMRAASHDFDSASLMGVSVGRVVTITFLIGSALAGAGAMMYATVLRTPLTPFMGVTPGIKAFVAAVLGGIGNIPGAVLGGLLMGVVETLAVWAGFSGYKDAVAFVILIVVLLFKPGGLLGSAKVEKV